MHGWNQTYEYLFKDQTYNLLSSSDYKLLSTATYYLGEAKMLRLEEDGNRRLARTIYGIGEKPSNKTYCILHTPINYQKLINECVLFVIRYFAQKENISV